MLLFAVHGLQRYPSSDGRIPFLAQLERLVYDARLKLTASGGVEPGSTDGRTLEWLAVGPLRIPVDQSAAALVLGEATHRLAAGIVFREVDRIGLRGKDEAITVYEPLGLDNELGQNAAHELELWNCTLRAYRDRQWDRAESDLVDLVRMNPTCGLYRAYAAKVAEKRRNPPPPEWNGVSAFEEK